MAKLEINNFGLTMTRLISQGLGIIENSRYEFPILEENSQTDIEKKGGSLVAAGTKIGYNTIFVPSPQVNEYALSCR